MNQTSTCFHCVAPGDLVAKAGGAEIPPGLRTRGYDGPLDAVTLALPWGCGQPLRRPEKLCCWTGSAAGEDAV